VTDIILTIALLVLLVFVTFVKVNVERQGFRNDEEDK